MKLTVTKQFQSYLKNIGIDLLTILQHANLPNKLWQEEMSLTTMEYYRFLEEIDKRLSEKNIRELSKLENLQMFVPAFFAALSAPNGLEALNRFSKFKKIIGPIDVSVEHIDTTISITYSFSHKEIALTKFSILNEQLMVLNLLRMGTGEHLIPLRIESPFDYSKSTIKEFGMSVLKSSNNSIVFNCTDLAKPFLTQNNVMWQYLEPALVKNLTDQNDTTCFRNCVQNELFQSLASGSFSIDDISYKLGVSVRTLQRRLAEENTNFKNELQIVQESMAYTYIRQGMSSEEISSLVGYNEVASFRRAFKTWTGMTISQYKKQFDNK